MLNILLSIGACLSFMGEQKLIETNDFISKNANMEIVEYENNDSSNDTYDTAINVCPDDYYQLDSYRTTISGKLDYYLGFEDTDMYYLKVLTDSDVEIDLNVNDSNKIYDYVI
jgi:hypothetical protein